MERLLELIARRLDSTVPDGGAWHHDLLRQMVLEVPGVRPAVLSADRLPLLDELRRFRHVVRNVYAIDLDPRRVAPLLAVLAALWPEVRSDLLAFARFLDDLGSGTTPLPRPEKPGKPSPT